MECAHTSHRFHFSSVAKKFRWCRGLSQVLSHDVNFGYGEEHSNDIVKKINGPSASPLISQKHVPVPKHSIIRELLSTLVSLDCGENKRSQRKSEQITQS